MSRSEHEALLKLLIHIASRGARAEKTTLETTNWEKLVCLACEHGVIPLVSCALKHMSAHNCPANILQSLSENMQQNSAINMLRKQRTLHLVSNMQNAGFDVLLLKGYAIAEYYAYPECRDSVDTDLLIEEKQEKALYDYLAQKGFQVRPRMLTSHHGVCQHAKYGKIEIHTALYDEIVENVWFQSVSANDYICEVPVYRETDGVRYKTLGITDHLLFLILHMVKHFVSNGLTIRMMLDVALYFSANREQVDGDRLWGNLVQLNFATLVNNILWIMVEYGGFAKSEFPGISVQKPEQVDLILDDLLRGGYMGRKEVEKRHQSSMEFNRQVALKNKSRFEYLAYMWNWKIRSALRNMCLDKSRLMKAYPVTQRCVLLIPGVWIYHFVSYPVLKLRSGIVNKEILSSCEKITQDERIEMFKRLEMI